MAYKNLTIKTLADVRGVSLEKDQLIYHVCHNGGKCTDFIAPKRPNMWLRSRLSHFDQHGTMEGY